MPKHIPILAAKDIAKAHDCRQVIVVAWDGERTHVVTYGVTDEECLQAAEGGNRVKKALNWPASPCTAEPHRVVKLKARIADLEASNGALQANAVQYRRMIADLEGRIANALL